MTRPATNQRGFSPLVIMLLLAVLGAAGFAAWRIWQRHDAVPPANHSYLVIKQWNVKLPLTSNTKDAFYTQTNLSEAWMHITTHTLQDLVAGVGGCKSGLDDVYLARSATKPGNQYAWPPKRLGNYYYYLASVLEPACVSNISGSSAAKINVIQNDLRHSLLQLSAR